MTNPEETLIASAYQQLLYVLDAESLYDIDISEIRDIVYAMEEQFPNICQPPQDVDESMDGDAVSALASAGFGTDEDYGGCAE